MDRKEFLSRTASTLDFIFVPSSFHRWEKRNDCYYNSFDKDYDAYFIVGVAEFLRLGLEVGAIAGLVYYLFN